MLLKGQMEIQNPNYECYPGQILQANKNRNKDGSPAHMMVFLSSSADKEMYFIGAMLTSVIKAKYSNVPLDNEMFISEDKHGNKYSFPTKTTAVRGRKLLKLVEWAPFIVVGELTPDGLAFVEKITGDTRPTVDERNANQ